MHEPVDTREQLQQPQSSLYSDAHRPALIDVIFVHGLGGSSRGTWTHPKSGFWPTWLPEKSGLENVRISTFGYDANWDIRKPHNELGIADFSRELLGELDLHYGRYGDVYSLSSHLLIMRLLLSSWLTAWADWWSKRSSELTAFKLTIGHH